MIQMTLFWKQERSSAKAGGADNVVEPSGENLSKKYCIELKHKSQANLTPKQKRLSKQSLGI